MTFVARLLNDRLAIDLGWFLFHVIWQATIVALALSALLAFIDHRAARLRYALSTIALALMLAVPVCTAFGVDPVSVSTGWAPPVRGHAPFSGEMSTAGGQVSSLVSQALSELTAWLPWLVVLWLGGVLFLTSRTFVGWWTARALTRSGVIDLPEPALRRFINLKRRFGIGRDVVFRESRRAEVPAVIGYFRPVLLLPISMLSGMTMQQVDAIVAHELAHIRRHDYLVNMFQQLVEILLFFHPAMWWVSSQIRREREHCCDDLAVLVCGDVLTYATALLSLEEQRGAAPRLALAATHGRLADRIRRLIGRTEMQPGTRTVIVPLLLASVLLSAVIVTAQQTGLPTRLFTAERGAVAPETTVRPTRELVTMFDQAADPKVRQEIISRLSGALSPEAWNKLVSIAQSDADLEIRKTAVSYIAGRPSLEALSALYDRTDSREMKLHILSYIHGLQSDTAMAKVRTIAGSERDMAVRVKAIDYLSGR